MRFEEGEMEGWRSERGRDEGREDLRGKGEETERK